MASVKFQFSIDRGFSRSLFDKISQIVGRRMRDNFGDVRPLVEETVNEAVEDNRGRFIPTNNEIAELGIGQGGSPDNRSQTAWIALRPSSRNGVTSISVRKRGSEGTNLIGEIKISIDPELFYQQPDSIIPTPDSNEIDEIPWMNWLIEGKTINQHSFTDRLTPNSVSRTGRGIMINGGFWSINGRGAEVYSRILNDARLSVNRRLKTNEGVRILRRLR